MEKSAINPFLFVYGSLRPDMQNDMASRLSAESVSMGKIQVSGLLFDLGEYPGLIQAEAGRMVEGYLLRLYSLDTFDWLDEYEAYCPEDKNGSLFVRKQVLVRHGCKELMTNLYFYNKEIGSARLVESGCWKNYYEDETPD